MHVKELVEFGALIATHGPLLIGQEPLLAERHIQQYWLASRCRQDRWGRALRQFRDELALGCAQPAWVTIQPTMEEILVSELFTRVWTALCIVSDQHFRQTHLEPVARSVLFGHMEARNRVLTLLVKTQNAAGLEGARMNRLRSRVERWTDLLLAQLIDHHDVSEMAFQPQRAGEFNADRRHEQASLPPQRARELTLAALHAAFARNLSVDSPNADLNRQIASAVLASFPPGVFDAAGCSSRVWLLRLDQVTDDMQELVAELLCVAP